MFVVTALVFWVCFLVVGVRVCCALLICARWLCVALNFGLVTLVCYQGTFGLLFNRIPN